MKRLKMPGEHFDNFFLSRKPHRHPPCDPVLRLPLCRLCDTGRQRIQKTNGSRSLQEQKKIKAAEGDSTAALDGDKRKWGHLPLVHVKKAYVLANLHVRIGAGYFPSETNNRPSFLFKATLNKCALLFGEPGSQ